MKEKVLYSVFGLNAIFFFYFLLTNSYSQILIALHIISIFCIIVFAIGNKIEVLFKTHYKVDIFLTVGFVLFALLVYIHQIDVVTPGFQGDEITVAKTAQELVSRNTFVPFVDVNYGHPTPLLYFTGLMIEWFGKSVMSIRLPSILFGALSVAAFYVLLRFFCSIKISVIATSLFLFSYPLIIVSRLAYEITPALFFQILSVILGVLLWRTKDTRYIILLGLVLGMGFYTYVGYRTFALIAIFIVSLYAFYRAASIKDKLKKYFLFVASLFIVCMPFLSFSINHPDQIVSRAASLSVFHQGLPANEVLKELQGNVFRLNSLFFPTSGIDSSANGDPNPRNNPAYATTFDILSVLLLIVSLILLARKNKLLFVIVLLLSLSPIVNDVFSLERVPEGHYYGLGHPNTLRIAGLIPIIYFVIAFGLQDIGAKIGKTQSGAFVTIAGIVSFFIIAYNWNLYFNQPYSEYIHLYNGAKTMKVVNAINELSFKKIYVSPNIYNDDRTKYFISNDKQLFVYDPKSVDQIFVDSQKLNTIVLDPDYNEQIGRAYLERITSQPDTFKGNIIVSPDNKVDAFVIKKGM